MHSAAAPITTKCLLRHKSILGSLKALNFVWLTIQVISFTVHRHAHSIRVCVNGKENSLQLFHCHVTALTNLHIARYAGTQLIGHIHSEISISYRCIVLFVLRYCNQFIIRFFGSVIVKNRQQNSSIRGGFFEKFSN